MYRLCIAPTLLALAACTTSPVEPLTPPAALAPSDTAAPIAVLANVETGGAAATAAVEPAGEVETVDIAELDSGMVCTSAKRPGSRIVENFCYTREESAANSAVQDAQAREALRAYDRSAEEAKRAALERERQRALGRQ
jgi:hypothetical protein